MSSVDARSHVYKRLLNINTFRTYTNIILLMQKIPKGKHIRNGFINIKKNFINLEYFYIFVEGLKIMLV